MVRREKRNTLPNIIPISQRLGFRVSGLFPPNHHKIRIAQRPTSRSNASRIAVQKGPGEIKKYVPDLGIHQKPKKDHAVKNPAI